MRGQHLIQCRRLDGWLVYRLEHPEAADLLAVARSLLQARTVASVASVAADAELRNRRNHAGPALCLSPQPLPGRSEPASYSANRFTSPRGRDHTRTYRIDETLQSRVGVSGPGRSP